MPVRLELALAGALALAGCAAVAPAPDSPDEEARATAGRVGEASELGGYLELAAVVADAAPDRVPPIKEHFEDSLAADGRSIAGRVRLAVVLINDSKASAIELERAQALLVDVARDEAASDEVRRFAHLLARHVERRLELSRLLAQRGAELARTRAALARGEQSRGESAAEIDALREALALSQTKLRELVRIEQAVDTSDAPGVTR